MSRILSLLKEALQLALAIFLASVGLKAFLLPNGFLDGGITGVALLVGLLTGANVSVLLVLFSIPFLALTYFTMARTIFIKSIIGIVGLAFAIQLEHFPVITDDKLLVAFFGGLFLGMGIGLAIRVGAVIDGTESLGVWLNQRFGIEIGRFILFFNVILFILTAMLVDVETALYSILTFVVTAKVIDTVMKGLEDYIGVMIVSKRSEELQNAIAQELGIGMTVYHGKRGFGRNGITEDHDVIHAIINRIDIRRIQRTVEEIDPDAFVMEYDVNSIQGGLTRRFLPRFH